MDFKRYLTEAAMAAEQPVTGDAFDISVNEMLNVECSVIDHGPDSVTIMLDERAISMLEHCGCQFTGESSAGEPEDDDMDQDDKRYDDAEDDDAGDDDAGDNEKIEESSHVVKHATHGAVYAKDGKAKLFMTRREAEEVADAMASKHGGSGISVTQAPYTGYFVKMPETKIEMEEADHSETDSHGPYARGSADADYGRKYEPHKFVDNGKGGKIKEVLTDPGEIAQYKKGYTTGGVDKQDFSEQIHEEHMSEKDAERLAQKHVNAAKLAKEAGNLKSYDAHAKASNYIRDMILKHTGSAKGIPSGKIQRTAKNLFRESSEHKIKEAEYQGREVKLGKPTSGDVKKFKVYVKDPKTGNVKKVNFGDPNMEIKRDNPERRKNFRARHNCADKTDRTKAGYWSCRMWSSKPVSQIV